MQEIKLGYGEITFGIDGNTFIIGRLPEAQEIGTAIINPIEEELVRITCNSEESFLVLCGALDKWKTKWLLENSKRTDGVCV